MASTPKRLGLDVNILVGLASALWPELVTRHPPDQVRRFAVESLHAARAERTIPDAFLDAWEPER